MDRMKDKERKAVNDIEPDTSRTVDDSEEIAIYNEGWCVGIPIVVPQKDETDFSDLGEYVPDRIEANNGVTYPEELPNESQKAKLGAVYWDESGKPIKLVKPTDEVIFFNENGVVIQVTQIIV